MSEFYRELALIFFTARRTCIARYMVCLRSAVVHTGRCSARRVWRGATSHTRHDGSSRRVVRQRLNHTSQKTSCCESPVNQPPLMRLKSLSTRNVYWSRASVCLLVCPRPHAHTTAPTRI